MPTTTNLLAFDGGDSVQRNIVINNTIPGVSWTWTHTSVDNVEDLVDAHTELGRNHLIALHHQKWLKETLEKKPKTAKEKQPIIEPRSNHDVIVIPDLNPAVDDAQYVSIVVSTSRIDTRGCGCDPLFQQVAASCDKEHKGSCRPITTALVLGEILRLPTEAMLSKLELLESEVDEIRDIVLGTNFLIGKNFRNHIVEIHKDLSILRKVLCGYHRLCKQLLNDRVGAFSERVENFDDLERGKQIADEIKREVEQYIGGVMLDIEASLTKEQQLEETLQIADDALANRHTAFTNVWLAIVSIILVIANLPAALFGMNFQNGLPKWNFETVCWSIISCTFAVLLVASIIIFRSSRVPKRYKEQYKKRFSPG